MTQRTYDELIALYPDNTTGLISPQDLRDLVDSVRAPHGRVHMSTPAATTIGTPGTFVKVAGTFALDSHFHLTTPDTTGRVTYNGTSPRHCHVVCSLSMTCAGNNQDIAIRLAVNGNTDPATQARRKIGTGTDIGSTAIHGDALLNANDYIEVYVTNLTSTASITVQDCYLFVIGML